jgi:hypothetical protein
MLVLLTAVIYEVDCGDDLRLHSIYIYTKFDENWFTHSGNIKVNTSTI